MSDTPKIRFAHILAWGGCPKYLECPAPSRKGSAPGEVQIVVKGVAIHKLVHLRISGKHYSASTLPHTPGVDGVGITPDGQEVYFFTFDSSAGSFAELLNVSKKNVFPIPPGLGSLQTAALVNPAMSSWMALRKRTVSLPANYSALILGATSTSGSLAIPVLRALGAGRVTGCARSQSKLDELDLDHSIRLRDPVVDTDFSSLDHIDVILDYVYGPPAAHLLISLKTNKLVQYLQIGDLASKEITLHSKATRSKNLIMTGSGLGSWTFDELREELPQLLEALAKFEPLPLNIVPVKEIEKIWTADTAAERVVYTF